MRPTDLRYRSPKEKTAEYLLPKITNNGNLLLEIVSKKKHPNFSHDRRFQNYEVEAKKTGFRVGPGSYNQTYFSVGSAHVKGAHVYKKNHRNEDMSNNCYLFIGDQIMFDSSFMLPSKKGPKQEISHTTDTCGFKSSPYNRASRSTTSNTPGRKIKNRPNVMSPNYEEFNYTRSSDIS
jgi:hypothetical protein